MFTPHSDLTRHTAAKQLDEGIAAINAGQSTMTFDQVIAVDSTAVACLLGWKRHADESGIKLTFEHVPENLSKLMTLYGVAELFDLK
jgi:phospholipid transport system transporter-binding protein